MKDGPSARPSARPFPRLMLIGEGFTQSQIAEKIKKSVLLGVEWVQLRDHNASEPAFLDAALALKSDLLSINPDLLLSVNSRLSVASRLRLPYHTGFRGQSLAAARAALGPTAIVGQSLHVADEYAPELSEIAHYVLFSPVFTTQSHPEATPVGVESLGQMCERLAPLPVFALGGISPANTASCLNAGAYGIAVHSAILMAENLSESIQQFKSSFSGR